MGARGGVENEVERASQMQGSLLLAVLTKAQAEQGSSATSGKSSTRRSPAGPSCVSPMGSFPALRSVLLMSFVP